MTQQNGSDVARWGGDIKIEMSDEVLCKEQLLLSGWQLQIDGEFTVL